MNVDSMWALEPLKDGHQDDTNQFVTGPVFTFKTGENAAKPNWIHGQRMEHPQKVVLSKQP